MSAKNIKSVQGSINNKIVASELVAERSNKNFDGNEIFKFFAQDSEYKVFKENVGRHIDENPIL